MDERYSLAIAGGAKDRVRSIWGRKTAERGVTIQHVAGQSATQSLQQTVQTLYSGSSTTDTTADFPGDWRSVDNWLRFELKTIRDRSRQLERGNPWCQSFKGSLLNNVCGAFGFKFRGNVVLSKAYGDTGEEGELDKPANRKIADARKKFCKEENFTTVKTLTEKECDRLVVQRLAFDGEFIVRKVRGFDNDFAFSWHVIDPDFLDHQLNRINAENGNIIRMGVEFDKTFKFPVAYWFLTRRPNETFYDYNGSPADKYVRVPAEDVRHVFIKEYPEQARGIPWIFSSIVNLKMIGAYEEAALINARVGANKMGFFKKTTPPTAGESVRGPETGRIIDYSEAGTWTELPWDVEPVPWNPSYPDAEFGPFNKAMLRSISASLRMSYMSLSNDLSEANFSSLRAGLNEEREQWMAVQEFIIEKWKLPEYEEWLYRAMLSGELALPIGKFDKFNAAVYTGRRWPFVNPIQDLQAKQLALDMRVTSITAIIEESGGTRDEVFSQIERDDKELESRGIQRIHSSFQVVDIEAAMEAANKQQLALPTGDGKK